MITTRLLSTVAAAAAALVIAGGAQAAVTFQTITGADTVDPTAQAVITFDAGGAAYAVVGNSQVLSGPVTNESAVPAGASGNYLVVPATGGVGGVAPYEATLTSAALATASTLSFLWGSVDVFNTVTINQIGGGSVVINGSQFSPANGTTTARVTVTDLTGVSSIVFTDNAAINGSFRAFEVDTIRINGAVPEPAIWGMMVLGFGVVGAALRTSRRKVIFA